MSRNEPPLLGVRILELADGVAGPYAGRLLAMLGATVVKAEPERGDEARATPVDTRPLTGTSPLYLHLNAGKRNVTSGALDLERALDWADAVIDNRVRRQLAGTLLAPEALAAREKAPVLISVTAWGFEADEPGRVRDELLVQARSGIMCTTGDPGGAPLRFPGWQAQYFAGGYAAVAALAALREPDFPHVDVPWIACIATGVEGAVQHYLQTGRQPRAAGSHPVHLFPGGAFRCADGHVVPGAIRESDWRRQGAVYGTPELVEDERFAHRRKRAENYRELWDLIQPWYDAHTKREIFDAAVEVEWALGMILTSRDALEDPHLREREFLAEHAAPEGSFVAPAAPWRSSGLPLPDQRVVAPGADDGEAALAGDGVAHVRTRLAGLRVIELTVAWAGPFVGRLLGALGADVIKVEAERYYDGWRGYPRFREMFAQVPGGHDPEARSHDIAGNFNALNRNKRGLSLDLATEAGREVLLRLVARADVVACNFTQRVLPNLGLDYEALRAVNPAIILLTMPALGNTGPFRGAAGYGSIIEGMGGFASRFGRIDEGARVSQTFFPDPVAGLHGVVALLSALERRDRTGEGCELDLSQQEVLWMQLGEGIALASREGCDPERMGNAEPGMATSGCFETRGGRWLAVVSERELGDLLEKSRERELEDLAAELERRGAATSPVHGYGAATSDPRLSGFVERVHHPVTEEQAYLRIPLRIAGQPVDTRRPAPVFGEHTDEILRDWISASDAELAAWRAAAIIGGQADLARMMGRQR